MFSPRAYVWKVPAGRRGGYVKTFGEKKNKFFGWKHLFFIKKWDSTLFRQISGSDKWDLRERYDGSNFGEKENAWRIQTNASLQPQLLGDIKK